MLMYNGQIVYTKTQNKTSLYDLATTIRTLQLDTQELVRTYVTG